MHQTFESQDDAFAQALCWLEAHDVKGVYVVIGPADIVAPLSKE